jgi:histidinol-phosphate transaminase
MNQLSLAAAKFSLKHHQIIQQNIDTLKNERSRVMNELLKLNRLEVFPSEANFITVRVPDANGLFETLKQNRILIKKLHGSHPLLDQCVRITIGSAAQNDAVLAVIKNLYPNL